MNKETKKILTKGSCIKCAISINKSGKANIVGKEGDIFDEEYANFQKQHKQIDLEGHIACKNRRYNRKHKKAFDMAFDELEKEIKSIFKRYYSNRKINVKCKVTFKIKLSPMMIDIKKVTISGTISPKDIFCFAEYSIIGEFTFSKNPESFDGKEKAFEERFEDLIKTIKSYCL